MMNWTRAMAAGLGVLLAAIGAGSANAQQINPPQLQADKWLSSPPAIEKNEWIKLTLNLTGQRKEQTGRVPSAVVFALDYSTSMKANDNYKTVASATEQIIDLLKMNQDKIGVIRFSDSANVAVGLTTTGFQAAKATVAGLQATGFTNIKDAFDQANTELAQDTSSNKIVILMTDGSPQIDTSGPDPSQEIYIYNNRFVPANSGIKYYPVVFGAQPNIYLKTLAEATGGQYCLATAVSDIVTCFKDALTDSGYHLVTTDVAIHEVVDSDLKVRPGSLAVTYTSPRTDVAAFDAAKMVAEQKFYTSNVLSLPKLNVLEDQKTFHISFDVTSPRCWEDDTDIEVDDLSATKITYRNGLPQQAQVPASDLKVMLTVKACAVNAEKFFDPATGTMTMRIVNQLPTPLIDVNLNEKMNAPFHPMPPVAPSPSNPASVAGGTLHWFFDKIDAGATAEATFAVDTSKVPAGATYQMNDEEGTLASFTMFDRRDTVVEGDPDYATLEAFLQTGTFSSKVVAFFNNHASLPELQPIREFDPVLPDDYVLESTNDPRLPFTASLRAVQFAWPVLDFTKEYDSVLKKNVIVIYHRDVNAFRAFNKVSFTK